jgi:hypothetical protein
LRYFTHSVASLFPRLLALIAAIALSTTLTLAQQTLGGMTGSVSDASGGVIPNATVIVINEQTSLTRTIKTNAEGEYNFVNLPIGTYTLTFTADGFDIQKSAHISVQADRTLSLNAQLKVAAAKGETIEVDATPLMNAVDTTVGYVLDNSQLTAIPLPTGSFTGAAILTPGVNAELSGGTGANSGLGNQPIWANGQRDTSNSFSLNGVDATNLFNGKSTSQISSDRVINSTGSAGSGAAGVIQSVASVYLSIGNAIPTPAPETLQEVKVNASMYDATQGSTSGAHIDLNTASGTNKYHGGVYYTRGTNWINAAPFFFKQDADVPDGYKNPDLHRNLVGGTFGGPIIKDKLFGFLSYQHLSVADQEIGDGFLQVPVGLSQCATRDAACLTNIINAQYGSENSVGNYAPFTPSQISPMALELFNLPAVAGEPGTYLIPSDTSSSTLGPNQGYNAFLPGTGRFKADLAVADVDWNASSKDTFAVKYYYQHDPTLAPYAYSSVPGFTEHLDSGAQVFSIINTYIVKSNLSTTQTLGFIREKNYATNEQPYGPNNMPATSFGTPSFNMFGSNYFPGVSIVNVLGNAAYSSGAPSTGILNIGPNAEGQAPNTGMFQNRIAPSGNAIWLLGKHTLSFGAGYTYSQLNTIDKRTGNGTITSDDFSAFSQGFVSPGSSSTGFYVTSFLQGDASRYYRANQLGLFVQDKYQITPTLSLTAGLRYDWDGGLTEKYGRILNFDAGTNPYNCSSSSSGSSDPNAYDYCVASDTIVNAGLVIAGNNANGTRGISNTTLTGRQWGIAPRLGAAWQPEFFHNKLVVRAGGGFYYDRGELFSYLSPGYALGTVTGGPFGVNQQLPFVNVSQCPAATQSLYNGYIPTCGGENAFGSPATAPTDETGDLANPYGTALQYAAPSSPKATDLTNYLPNACSIANTGLAGISGICPNTPSNGEIVHNGVPISLGVYDRANKLPYTVNYTLDLQWQPRNDLAVELGYIGNLSRHQVIPVPMNQASIASPTSPTLAGGPWQQNYSYGYTVGSPATLPDGTSYMANPEGGNDDLRVPYIGWATESIKYVAAGIGAYNALQAHIEKRMSKGIQVGASYTYSHSTDEQSGLGLFYSGSNALNLRSGYGLSDFDRTHVLNFNYIFQLPNMAPKSSLLGKFVDDWSLTGLTVLQSGQPYSVTDFSGAIASVYYSTFDGITNPIVPLAKGCTAKSAKTGHSGAFYPINGYTALNPACFTLPLLAPGSMNGAIPTSDPYETGFTSGQRNIFRQSFQKRADASLTKLVNFKERFDLKYTLDVFNLSNTPSFDIPGNEPAINLNYNNFPSYVPPGSNVLPTGCGTQNPQTGAGGLYYCPDVGIVGHTIGSNRQVQMSLSLKF